MTGRGAARWSSAGVSVRPSAALTPTAWKKLPVTNPPLVLEAVECGVEGTLVNLQYILRDLLNTLGDRPTVQRLALQRPKD